MKLPIEINEAIIKTIRLDERAYHQYRHTMASKKCRVVYLSEYFKNINTDVNIDIRGLLSALNIDPLRYIWVNYLHPYQYLSILPTAGYNIGRELKLDEYFSWVEIINKPSMTICKFQLMLHNQFRQIMLNTAFDFSVFGHRQQVSLFLSDSEIDSLGLKWGSVVDE